MNIARLASALLATAVLQAASLGAGQQESGPAVDFPTGDGIVKALCTAIDVSGKPLVLTGARMRVVWLIDDDGADRLATALLAFGESNRSLSLGATGTWILIHDHANAVAYRRSCGGAWRTFRYVQPPRQVAVSAVGDVAARFSNGTVQVHLNGSTQEPLLIDAGQSGDPQLLMWYGRRLIGFGRDAISRIDFDTRGRTAARPSKIAVDPPIENAATAFVFNGLTYLVRQSGCLDLHVNMDMNPRLRHVKCVPDLREGDYLRANEKSIQVVEPDGRVRSDVPRPSAVLAQLVGTTQDNARALTELSQAPWVLRSPSVGAGAAPASKFWSQWFQPEWWPNGQEYARALSSFDGRGWRAVSTPDEIWFNGPAVALRARPVDRFSSTHGLTLSSFARAYYQEKGYTNQHVRDVLDANSELAESIEGHLATAGWLPIGAVAGQSVTFEAHGSAAPALGCQPASLTNELGEALRTGAPTSGVMPTSLRRAFGKVDYIRLASDDAAELCVQPSLRGGAGQLVLKSAKLKLLRNNRTVHLTKASQTIEGVTFSRTDDPDWPIAIQSPITLALAPESPESRDAVAQRWLENLFPVYAGTLYLPTTVVDVVLAFEGGGSPWKSSPHIEYSSYEVSSKGGRSVKEQPAPCTADEALKQRLAHENQIRLHIPYDDRISKVRIGVAERAAPLLSEIFERPGGRMWMGLNGTQLGPIQTPIPDHQNEVHRPKPDRNHGMNVAAIIAAQKQMRGVLKDVDLIWIDVTEGSQANGTLISALAARRAIVNVSQHVDAWKDLKANAQDWRNKQLLFIAAERNTNADPHGFPLEWEVANVIGVGVAKPDGSMPDDHNYESKVVHLLAPGVNVPSIDETGGIECDSGTSFASAYTSAVAALLATRKSVPFDVVQARLLATAEWNASYRTHVRGGLLDANRALQWPDANRLTIERPGAEDLELDVDLDTNKILQYSASDGSTGPQSVPWESILRLHPLESPTSSGSPSFRIVAVISKKLEIIDNVFISPSTTIPIIRCPALNAKQTIECFDVPVWGIKDYVGKMDYLEIVSF